MNNFRVILGSVLAWFYNHLLTHVPMRTIRKGYLKLWLAEYGVGAGVQLGCQFLNGRKVCLGKRNVINHGCLLDGRKFTIRIGDDVSIGPDASILTLGHDPQSPSFEDRGGDVIVGDRVWIGYRAMVLPGVTIGEGAVVGAGSVVVKDVEPFSIVAGNPAKKIGERYRDINYQLDYHPWLS
ncbi:MAG: acyltransferase [Verrucomicrobiae bacterium]|nr:acyltransferase [Verrucomicrobiae bacterium]NNJ44012.1 acyltransferase [Akkermansiaceae bacterium]